LINFEEEQGENEDMFFLVRWKKGETYCVSFPGFQHNPPCHHLYIMFSFSPPANGEAMDALISFHKTPY